MIQMRTNNIAFGMKFKVVDKKTDWPEHGKMPENFEKGVALAKKDFKDDSSNRCEMHVVHPRAGSFLISTIGQNSNRGPITVITPVIFKGENPPFGDKSFLNTNPIILNEPLDLKDKSPEEVAGFIKHSYGNACIEAGDLDYKRSEPMYREVGKDVARVMGLTK